MVGLGFLAKWAGVSRRRRSAECYSQLEEDEHPPESDTRNEEKDESTNIVVQIPARDEHSSIQESNRWFQIAYEAGTRITKVVKMGIGYFKLEDELESEARSLPEELVMEILARTAFKTLLRCRCVCRKWNSLISEPSFVKIHLLNNHNTTNDEEEVGDYMIFSNKKSGPQSFSFYDGYVGKTIIFPKVSYAFRHSLPSGGENFSPYCPLVNSPCFSKFKRVGCCNGLLCLLSSEGVFLWNPALNKVRFVEETEMLSRDFGGLTFDPQTMEFKVVAICGFILNPPDVRIYSTSTNLWKIAAHNDLRRWRIQQKCPAPFVKGALHWYAERQRQVILCFDVSEEAFREINVPSLNTMARVKEFQGTIACFLDDQNDQSWEVWVMKEYGVEDSWAKLYTIGYSHGRPLEIMNDGIVMLIGANGEFLLFDPTTENFQGRKVEVKHGCKDMVSYKGSLAMLNEGNQSRFCLFCGSAFAMVVCNCTLLWFGFQQKHFALSMERSTTGSEC